MLLTKSIHLHVQAFLETASLALVPTLLVYNTIPAAFASVHHVPSDAAHKKSAAPIASVHSVMPTRGDITTNFAQNLWLALRFLRSLLGRQSIMLSAQLLIICEV